MYTIEQINEVKKYEADSMAVILNSLMGAPIEIEKIEVQNPDDASDNDETTIEKGE